MRLTTWNVNGLRAAVKKGFDARLRALSPDVLLLQEVRALPEQLPAEAARPAGWHVAWHPAEKKGYAGTAIWSRQPLELLGTGLDAPDPEGRVLRARVGGVQVVSVYLPSGSSSPGRQAAKERWMVDFAAWTARLVDLDEPVLLGGDLNIAHTRDDIHDPVGNAKSSGFLPHEREWFTDLLGQGWTDLQRAHQGPGRAAWTWWSNRGRARELDRGWRIDYLLANRACARPAHVGVDREAGLAISDHGPVSATWDGAVGA